IEEHGAGRRLARARELQDARRFLRAEQLDAAEGVAHTLASRYFKGSMPASSGSTASTTARACSPRLSSSHVLVRSGFSRSVPLLSVMIFTCGRNGSVGCSAVTTASSSV